MGHSEPYISVVVPAYNAERTIGDCIDSLLKQNLRKDEYRITVVDNKSRDNTASILHDFGNRITLLTEPTRGPSAARNLGILSGSSEIIAFIDADCVADPNWLKSLVGVLRDDAVGMVGGRILAKSRHDPVRKFGERIHDHQKAIERFEPPYIISMNSAMRRQVLTKVGLYDREFLRAEDVDLSWRILAAGYVLRYAADAIVYHDNEHRLSGLLREGCQHGYYGIKVKQRHNAYLIECGRNRNFFGHLRLTVRNIVRYVAADRRREQYLYQAVFNGGKTFGSLLGSLRFGYFEI